MKREKKFQPMLAPNEKTDLSKIVFPVLGSAKLDGIRAVKYDGILVSRNLKPIPNKHIQKLFEDLPEGMDGELICGNPCDKPYRRTVSAVMSEDGKPDVHLYAFDSFNPEIVEKGFSERLAYVSKQECSAPVMALNHRTVLNLEDLMEMEEAYVQMGFEGMMVRSLDGPYKFGRATQKQGWLLKIKRWEDAEATVIGFEERMRNGNEATTNALGHTERSSHKAGMIGRGDLGAFVVRGLNGTYEGIEFNVGGGMDDAERADFWQRREELLGKVIKFKYFATGSKEKPRFPVWLGWRDAGDM